MCVCMRACVCVRLFVVLVVRTYILCVLQVKLLAIFPFRTSCNFLKKLAERTGGR